MGAETKVALSNLMGGFIHCHNCGRAADTEACFADDATATLPLRDGCTAQVGREAIRDKLREWDQRYADGLELNYHLLNSPVIEVNGAGTEAQGVWMAISMSAHREPFASVEPIACRFALKFLKHGAEWKIKELEYRVFTSILPLSAEADSLRPIPRGIANAETYMPSFTNCKANSSDYWEISNLQSRYTYDQGSGLTEQFACSDDVLYDDVFLGRRFCGKQAIAEAAAELEERTIKNGGSLGWYTLMTPVIEVSPDGKRAQGWWNTYGFIIQGEGYGFVGETRALLPVVGRLHQEFVKENGVWKYKKFTHERLLRLENWKFTPGRPVGAGSKNIGRIQLTGKGEWPKAPAESGNYQVPEDYWNLVQTECWDISYLSSGRTSEFPPRFFAKDEPDVSSYVASPFAENKVGYEQVLKEFQAYEALRSRQGKSQSVHSATTPFIVVSADGQTAVTRWLDAGWTVHGSGMGNTEPPFPVVPVFGMYEHTFVKENGMWAIKKYSFYAMLQMYSWLADPDHSLGWSSGDRSEPWPLPCMPYDETT